MGLLDLLFGDDNSSPKIKQESTPEERAKNAGFRFTDNQDGKKCLFCDYKHYEDDRFFCEKNDMRLWEGFESSEYVCDYFNGSEFEKITDYLVKDFLNDESN